MIKSEFDEHVNGAAAEVIPTPAATITRYTRDGVVIGILAVNADTGEITRQVIG